MSPPRRRRHPVDNTRSPEGQGHGPAATRPPPQAQTRGVIMTSDANRHMYRVATPTGMRTMPRIKSGPGDNEVWPNGTQVVVDYSFGRPYITGCFPDETPASSPDEDTPNVTGVRGYGGEDSTMSRPVGGNARDANAPTDLLPGDRVVTGPDGAALGLLHGMIAMLKGGQMAQIRAYGHDDLIEIVSGLYRVITWMGEAKVVNENGKTSYIWRGGSDQLSQSGPDEERYTIRLDVGHTGDLFNFETTTIHGQTLFRFHVDPHGRLSIYAAGGIDQTGGGLEPADHPTRIAGNANRTVEGDVSDSIQGSHSVLVEGEGRREVDNSDNTLVGLDSVLQINRDWRVSVDGKVAHQFTDDVETQVTNGKYTITVLNGEFKIRTVTEKLILASALPDGIQLGDTGAFHSVKYEPLATYLAALVADYNAFKEAVRLHTHPGLGAVSPFVYTPFEGSHADAQSHKVTLD